MNLNSRWVALVALGLGCSSQKGAPSADTSHTVPAAAIPASGGSPSQTTVSTDCPHNGKWALCSLERRLTQSGFVVKRVGDATYREGFTVRPVVYTLGQSRLEVFVYTDSASVAKDVARLDTLAVGPVGKPSQWGEVPPTLIRSANIAAVILSQSARQIERAVNALTAGPPQAGSPR